MSNNKMTEPTDKQLLDTMLAIYQSKANMARALKQSPQTINHWFNTEGRGLSDGWRMYFLQQLKKAKNDY